MLQIQYEPKYQFLINKYGSVGLEHFNFPKAFIEYSNDIEDVYTNIGENTIQEKT